MPIQFKQNPHTWGVIVDVDANGISFTSGSFSTGTVKIFSFDLGAQRQKVNDAFSSCYNDFDTTTLKIGEVWQLQLNFSSQPPNWVFDMLGECLIEENCFINVVITTSDLWWMSGLEHFSRIDILTIRCERAKFNHLIIKFPFSIGEFSMVNFSAEYFSFVSELPSLGLGNAVIEQINLSSVKFLDLSGKIKINRFSSTQNVLGVTCMFMTNFSLHFLSDFKNLEALYINWIKSPIWLESDFQNLAKLNYLSVSSCHSVIQPIINIAENLKHVYLTGVQDMNVFETLIGRKVCKTICINFKQQKHQKIYEAKMLEHPDVITRLPFCYINNFHRNKDKGYWHAGYAE
jgi:hypothetical protein